MGPSSFGVVSNASSAHPSFAVSSHNAGDVGGGGVRGEVGTAGALWSGGLEGVGVRGEDIPNCAGVNAAGGGVALKNAIYFGGADGSL